MKSYSFLILLASLQSLSSDLSAKKLELFVSLAGKPETSSYS